MQHQSQGLEWYVSRKGEQYGPYTWDELLAHARQGLVRPGDKVFSPTTQSWAKASKVPGLLGPRGKPLSSGSGLAWTSALLSLTAVAVAVVLFAPVDWPWNTVDLGTYSYTPPATKPIATDEWGPTPPDRISILMAEGSGRAEAEAAATALGASIAGEMEIIDLYVLQTDGATEADLRASLEAAESQPGVEASFPEQASALTTTREGWRCADGGKLEDPAYSGSGADSYHMIGVQNAWDLIRASRTKLNPVQIGITDDGLYSSGEFDGGKVNFTSAHSDDTLSQPLNDASGSPQGHYSHGTAVASVLAADDDDGGVVGVATVLESNLTVSMTNLWGSEYASDPEAQADPDDPTVYTDSSGTWANGNLVALMDQVKNGSTIINCSWGSVITSGPPDPDTVTMYRKFFKWMQENRPAVLFVCAAGNNGKAPGKDGFFPGGIASPNVITVGNVDGDGKIGNTMTNTASEGFEVTLAAPGDGVPYGVAPDGTVVATNGGTSMAAPQVAAVAAMLRSIDPDLDASDIKAILAETARTELGGTAIELGVGGRVLAADQAVLWVLNLQRLADGKSQLTMDQALGGSRIDLVATFVEPPADDPAATGSWRVTATVPDVGANGVTLVARYTGSDAVAGDLTRTLSTAGSAEWTVSGNAAGVFHVKRSDSEACWRVQLGAAVAGDPAGDPAQAGDPATVTGATGDQQANGFPAAPVGPVAVENAIRAAVDDVGLTVRQFTATPIDRAQHPDARVSIFYSVTIDDAAGITVFTYDSPDEVRITANTDQDMPWAFHELTAYQCDFYWSHPPPADALLETRELRDRGAVPEFRRGELRRAS